MRTDLFVLSLSDQELWNGLKRISSNEYKVQSQFLAYLGEVEKRQLYLAEGYSSVFAFLTRELGYSRAEALMRIQVARQARRFPQIYAMLSERETSLTALARLCPHLKTHNGAELLRECEGKSVREVEEFLAERFPTQKSFSDKTSPLSGKTDLIQFEAPKEFRKDLEKLRTLLSHKYPKGKLCEILGEAMRELIKKHEPKAQRHTAEKAETENHTRYISREVRFEVTQRDAWRCAYVSASGHRCEETRFLQFDHITPWARGGTSKSADNIRLMCRAHNQYLARQAFGNAHIDRILFEWAHTQKNKTKDVSVPPHLGVTYPREAASHPRQGPAQ